MLMRLGRFVLALGVAAVGYLLIYRPLQLRWGATREEIRRAMPGDDIQPRPTFDATRSITIHARPQEIWPWLMQMGYGRAGWYGYDWIDNDGIPSSVQILPQWLQLRVGDAIPIWKNNDFPVTTLLPNRILVFASGSGKTGFSMALGLYPVDASNTRLAWRIRWATYSRNLPLLATLAFTDLSDFIAVRQILLGIKARVEGVPPEKPATMYIELVLWLGSFVAFLASEFALIFSRSFLKPFVVAAATGLLTVWLVLTNPTLWICILVTLIIWALLVWALRKRKAQVRTSDERGVAA